MAFFLLTFIYIFIEINNGDVIFQSLLENLSQFIDGWTVTGSTNACFQVTSDSCLGTLESCLNAYGGCEIERQAPLSFIGYNNIKMTFLVVESSEYGLESDDSFQIYTSINNGITWDLVTQYTGINFDYTGGDDYDVDDMITIDLPDNLNNRDNINIRFVNNGDHWLFDYDRVYLSNITITGDPIVAQPTSRPTLRPILQPTTSPLFTIRTLNPTSRPTARPSTSIESPTESPLSTASPTSRPTERPTFDTDYNDPCLSDPKRRHRRPWHLLSDEEKDEFVSAVKDLNDKISDGSITMNDDFASSHDIIFGGQAHGILIYVYMNIYWKYLCVF